jgi:hypothetical protein
MTHNIWFQDTPRFSAILTQCVEVLIDCQKETELRWMKEAQRSKMFMSH